MRPPKRSAEKTSRNSFFERVADDENDLAETGADGVVDRIIYDGLVVRADSVHLLERTVTGAHTCGEDE